MRQTYGPRRFDILCGIVGEIIEIDYDDVSDGRAWHIVTVSNFYVRSSRMHLEGLCHRIAAERAFALERIHFIRELTQDGAYESVSAWLGSYGITVKLLGGSRGPWRYEYVGPPIRYGSEI